MGDGAGDELAVDGVGVSMGPVGAGAHPAMVAQQSTAAASAPRVLSTAQAYRRVPRTGWVGGWVGSIVDERTYRWQPDSS